MLLNLKSKKIRRSAYTCRLLYLQLPCTTNCLHLALLLPVFFGLPHTIVERTVRFHFLHPLSRCWRSRKYTAYGEEWFRRHGMHCSFLYPLLLWHGCFSLVRIQNNFAKNFAHQLSFWIRYSYLVIFEWWFRSFCRRVAETPKILTVVKYWYAKVRVITMQPINFVQRSDDIAGFSKWKTRVWQRRA